MTQVVLNTADNAGSGINFCYSFHYLTGNRWEQTNYTNPLAGNLEQYRLIENIIIQATSSEGFQCQEHQEC